jgi:hypothetical protein
MNKIKKFKYIIDVALKHEINELTIYSIYHGRQHTKKQKSDRYYFRDRFRHAQNLQYSIQFCNFLSAKRRWKLFFKTGEKILADLGWSREAEFAKIQFGLNYWFIGIQYSSDGHRQF